jgi:hypothetical protein
MDLGASVPTVIASLNLSIPYHYHRVLPAKCWIGDCRGRNNWRAYRPCSFNGTLDESAVASEYNALGVRTIERMLSSLIAPSAIEEKAVLERAVTFFRAALKRDPRCLSASMNLAVVHLKMGYNKGVQDSIQSVRIQATKRNFHRSDSELCYHRFLIFFFQKDIHTNLHS